MFPSLCYRRACDREVIIITASRPSNKSHSRFLKSHPYYKVLRESGDMAQKNWDKIATKEFKAMDTDAQAQWAELRHRLGV